MTQVVIRLTYPGGHGDMTILGEHSIMIFPRLPIPIIAGSGGILSVFRTFILDEPEPMVASPVTFGRPLVYFEVSPTCCTTN